MRKIIDFQSAAYLGMQHSSQELLPWLQINTGKPAVLEEPPASRELAKAIAHLQGLEAGLLYPSSFHLFWDLFQSLSQRPITIFIDDQAYPIARWGAARAKELRIKIRPFTHNVQDLKTRFRFLNRQPVLLTDGWCTQCERAAPIQKYLDLLQPYDGLLILDDTQALGILGKHRNNTRPYGLGGGGVLPWLGIQNANLVVGSSLAKGFGVPLAVLSGQPKLVREISASSETRVHCSPPSIANIRAAQHALLLNAREGDQRRQLLLNNVKLFQDLLHSQGIETNKSLFPLQRLQGFRGKKAQFLSERLKRHGIKTVLVTGPKGLAQVAFLLRADHKPQEIYFTAKIISKFVTNRHAPLFRTYRPKPGDRSFR